MQEGDSDDEIAELRIQALLTKRENEAEISPAHESRSKSDVNHVNPNQSYPKYSHNPYPPLRQYPNYYGHYQRGSFPQGMRGKTINSSNIVVLTSSDDKTDTWHPNSNQNLRGNQWGRNRMAGMNRNAPSSQMKSQAPPLVLPQDKYSNTKEAPAPQQDATKAKLSARMRRLQGSDSDSDDSDSDSSNDSSSDSSSSDSSTDSSSSDSDSDSDSSSDGDRPSKENTQVNKEKGNLGLSADNVGSKNDKMKEKLLHDNHTPSHSLPKKSPTTVPGNQKSPGLKLPETRTKLISPDTRKENIPDESSKCATSKAKGSASPISKPNLAYSPRRRSPLSPLPPKSSYSKLSRSHSRSPRKYSISPKRVQNKKEYSPSLGRYSSKSPISRKYSRSPPKRFLSKSPQRKWPRFKSRSRSPFSPRRYRSKSPLSKGICRKRSITISPSRKFRCKSPSRKGSPYRRYGSRSPYRRYRSRSPLPRKYSRSPFSRMYDSPSRRTPPRKLSARHSKSPVRRYNSRSPPPRKSSPSIGLRRSRSPLPRKLEPWSPRRKTRKSSPYSNLSPGPNHSPRWKRKNSLSPRRNLSLSPSRKREKSPYQNAYSPVKKRELSPYFKHTANAGSMDMHKKLLSPIHRPRRSLSPDSSRLRRSPLHKGSPLVRRYSSKSPPYSTGRGSPSFSKSSVFDRRIDSPPFYEPGNEFSGEPVPRTNLNVNFSQRRVIPGTYSEGQSQGSWPPLKSGLLPVPYKPQISQYYHPKMEANDPRPDISNDFHGMRHPPPITRHPPPITRHPPPITRHPPPHMRHPPPFIRHQTPVMVNPNSQQLLRPSYLESSHSYPNRGWPVPSGRGGSVRHEGPGGYRSFPPSDRYPEPHYNPQIPPMRARGGRGPITRGVHSRLRGHGNLSGSFNENQRHAEQPYDYPYDDADIQRHRQLINQPNRRMQEDRNYSDSFPLQKPGSPIERIPRGPRTPPYSPEREPSPLEWQKQRELVKDRTPTLSPSPTRIIEQNEPIVHDDDAKPIRRRQSGTPERHENRFVEPLSEVVNSPINDRPHSKKISMQEYDDLPERSPVSRREELRHSAHPILDDQLEGLPSDISKRGSLRRSSLEKYAKKDAHHTPDKRDICDKVQYQSHDRHRGHEDLQRHSLEKHDRHVGVRNHSVENRNRHEDMRSHSLEKRNRHEDMRSHSLERRNRHEDMRSHSLEKRNRHEDMRNHSLEKHAKHEDGRNLALEKHERTGSGRHHSLDKPERHRDVQHHSVGKHDRHQEMRHYSLEKHENVRRHSPEERYSHDAVRHYSEKHVADRGRVRERYTNMSPRHASEAQIVKTSIDHSRSSGRKRESNHSHPRSPIKEKHEKARHSNKKEIPRGDISTKVEEKSDSKYRKPIKSKDYHGIDDNLRISSKEQRDKWDDSSRKVPSKSKNKKEPKSYSALNSKAIVKGKSHSPEKTLEPKKSLDIPEQFPDNEDTKKKKKKKQKEEKVKVSKKKKKEKDRKKKKESKKKKKQKSHEKLPLLEDHLSKKEKKTTLSHSKREVSKEHCRRTAAAHQEEPVGRESHREDDRNRREGMNTDSPWAPGRFENENRKRKQWEDGRDAPYHLKEERVFRRDRDAGRSRKDDCREDMPRGSKGFLVTVDSGSNRQVTHSGRDDASKGREKSIASSSSSSRLPVHMRLGPVDQKDSKSLHTDDTRLRNQSSSSANTRKGINRKEKTMDRRLRKVK